MSGQGHRFLRGHPSYERYLVDVASGALALPAYDTDNEGNIIIHFGERFCRHNACSFRVNKVST